MENHNEVETPYKLKTSCKCGCTAHCGFSCMTDDCDCNECLCPHCREEDVPQI